MGTFCVKTASAEIFCLVLYANRPSATEVFGPRQQPAGDAYLIPTNRMKQEKKDHRRNRA